MTTESIDATQEAGRAGGPTPADRLLERLAELIGAKAGVQAVFAPGSRLSGLIGTELAA
jgi:hypothetical protein